LIWRVEQWTWKERKKPKREARFGKDSDLRGEVRTTIWLKYGDSGRSTNFIGKFDPYKDLQESNTISTGNIPSGEA
jgi:hypothetical protein